MVLRVSHRASAVLKELLERHEHEPDQAIRLVSDAQGEGLVLGTEGERDRAIKHDGATVLIVEPAVNARFSNMTLDVEQTPKGYSWSLIRSSTLQVPAFDPRISSYGGKQAHRLKSKK